MNKLSCLKFLILLPKILFFKLDKHYKSFLHYALVLVPAAKFSINPFSSILRQQSLRKNES